ncbi:DUF1801 domain-containing protein [Rubinisphaera margarita]|uniref:DUF1801 domain-containing protein n=1 Tax=Rubinisphaera margarita TaxID=2909586 RepID=UPI001EE84FE2|nr:DUF1801 domain-containing protein [Rubinisphaera margarita]MCG6157523.1 DUF1801 domain-containing protein [Rubinisphaera margarita]
MKKSARTATTKSEASISASTPAELIDQRIAELGDWRGETLARIRDVVRQTNPDIVEEWKWRGMPTWSYNGILCTGETYRQAVKMTFAHGASLKDPTGLFNASLEGKTRRAIDFHEGDKVNARALKALIREAIAFNTSKAVGKAKNSATTSRKKTDSTSDQTTAEPVVLLSGGNPQIAKADGDAPVQAYIAAMPGWKSDLGRRLDELIVQAVPNVTKAVRWNSPFYGIEGEGWFLSFHCLTKYVKVTFFAGTSLEPLPPGGTERSQESRWIDIYENKPFDEGQFIHWVQQAAILPGWTP